MNTDKNLRPKGAIGIYLVENGKVLLLLRNSEHAGNTWCPPGGHIEYGESFLQAAKREAAEEAGVVFDDITILEVTSDVYREEKRHYVTVHVQPVSYTGQVVMKEPDKFSDMQWFDLSALPENLFPANKHFLSLNPSCLCGSGNKFKECHGASFKFNL